MSENVHKGQEFCQSTGGAECETRHGGLEFCQSCGMPLNDEVYGTNLDQTKNHEYCVYCFKDGKFTEEVTMEEMIDISAKHMVELHEGMTEEKAKNMMMSFFPSLKRWKK